MLHFSSPYHIFTHTVFVDTSITTIRSDYLRKREEELLHEIDVLSSIRHPDLVLPLGTLGFRKFRNPKP